VDGDGAVGLDHEQPTRPRQAGTEPTRVLHRAFSYEQAHVALYHGAEPDAGGSPSNTMRTLSMEGDPMFGTYLSDTYKIVLVLHILCAIIGFGAVFLNGLYGQQAKSHQGAAGLAIAEANELVTKVGEYFIYAVFVLGIALVLIGDPVHKFGQTWIWLAMTLYLIALTISRTLLFPGVRRLIALQRELVESGPPVAGSGPPPQVVQMEKVGKQVATYGAILNVMIVVVLTLMVFKPGSPLT
jgi:hypothetical protein